jgi:hypothetical protein
MLIVYGRKRKDTPAGHCFVFCPVCRDVVAHTIYSVGMAGHVYFVSVGSGEEVARYLSCDTCTLQSGAGRLGGLPRTRDKGRQVYASSLEIEARAAEGRLTPDERGVILRQAVGGIGRVAYGLPDPRARLVAGLAVVAFLTLLALPITAKLLFDFGLGRSATLPITLLLIVAAGSSVATFGLLLTSWSRKREQVVYPLLAESLRGLHPTADELMPLLSEAGLRSLDPVRTAKLADKHD